MLVVTSQVVYDLFTWQVFFKEKRLSSHTLYVKSFFFCVTSHLDVDTDANVKRNFFFHLSQYVPFPFERAHFAIYEPSIFFNYFMSGTLQ